MIGALPPTGNGFQPFSRGGIAKLASVFPKVSDVTRNFIGHIMLHDEYKSKASASAHR
ncbi:hypothetical protein ACQY0O_002409 [Thecaphora frezii]